MTLYSTKGLTKKQIQIQELVLNDFNSFVKVVAPYLQLGSCHRDVGNFLTQKDEKNRLVLFPRGHLKSKLLALCASWHVIKNPAITIIYASATATLAELQLSDIQRILLSPIISKLFPELMGTVREGVRDKWSATAINVEHPIRKEMGIRDNTVVAAGAGKNIVGLHCDILMLDDITAPNTDVDPWTKGGRDKCDSWVSLATSVLNPGGKVLAAGTRYHPKDVYATLKEMSVPIFDEDMNVIDSTPVYDIIERAVETDGEYLWPRRLAKNGNYYGFDDKVLATIKAQYKDEIQFYAQYYNDPTDPENRKIDPANFQYYNRSDLKYVLDTWRIGGKTLDVYAAMDIAATISDKSDYTALVIVGEDEDGYRYVLDIARLKTDKISVMSETLLQKYSKWRFKKFRIETNAQQGLVANQMQDNMRKHGAIFVWDKQPSRGNKHFRIMSILEPLYSTRSIFHYHGGNTEILEDELIATKPPHDDISDALAACMELIPIRLRKKNKNQNYSNLIYHPRFGGVL